MRDVLGPSGRLSRLGNRFQRWDGGTLDPEKATADALLPAEVFIRRVEVGGEGVEVGGEGVGWVGGCVCVGAGGLEYELITLK